MCSHRFRISKRFYKRMWSFVVMAGMLAVCDCSNCWADYTFDFSGQIDGSDTIRIEADRAVWSHLYWGWPSSVSLNGVSWQPSLDQELLFEGAALIPSDLENYTASVSVSSGRDVAVAEIKDDHLLIHLDDTPNGSDLYSFQVSLAEKTASTPTTATTLHVQANIDGSDRVCITNTEATLVHGYWSVPNSLSLNGISWNPSVDLTLANSGSTQFLQGDIDWSSARLTRNAGRDLATFEVFDDRIELVFADNPLGGDFYDVTIAFGAVPEPSVTVLVFSAVGLVIGFFRYRRV